jgi:four helix bundle protein
MEGISDSREPNLVNRSFHFAVRIVKLCQYIHDKQRSLRAVSNQLIKSGTSIGANIEEAQGAQSRADFITKYHIALKESRETSYWLRILKATETIPATRLEEILNECEEIKKMIGASIVTMKSADKK